VFQLPVGFSYGILEISSCQTSTCKQSILVLGMTGYVFLFIFL